MPLDPQLLLVCVHVYHCNILQVSKFSEYVSSVGQATLARIARAGPDSKVWCCCENHIIL